MICRTVEEVRAAAAADALNDPPLGDETAAILAAILGPHQRDQQAA